MSSDKPDDYRHDPYWQKRRLTPAQLLVHDIRLEIRRNGAGEILNIQEILSSTLVPDEFQRHELRDVLDVTELSRQPLEQAKWRTLVDEFGWLQSLRSHRTQQSAFEDPDLRKCRWM